MRYSILLLASLLLAGSASADTIQTSTSSDNPYAKTYVKHSDAAASTAAPAEPRIYRGSNKQADKQKLLEDGYGLLGDSEFDAGDVAPELLAEQAKAVRAELVLVYSRMTEMNLLGQQQVPASKKSEGSSGEQPQAGHSIPVKAPRYSYFSSYWIKLPRPVLGLHVMQEQGTKEGHAGLPVLAVVNNSPAAAAGMQKGDILLRLADVEMLTARVLAASEQHLAGKEVELVFLRAGSELRTKVKLNPLP